jgi:uncharacterized protein YggU (UPF0235/DUF167 family)
MAAPPIEPWRIAGNSIVLRVRLTPKGGADAIEGLGQTPDGPAIRARVRAAPEDNAANEALLALLAEALRLPRRDVSLAGGHKSRTKSVAIAGDPADIGSRLSRLIENL